MISTNNLLDVEVENEIQRLQKSHHVVLAQMYETVRYRRMELYNQLLALERQGKALEAAGVTQEMLDTFVEGW